MTPTIRTTSLILAAFALVGLMTTVAVAPPAFAQTVEWLNTITDATETENETTEQTLNQSETSDQSNSIDQDNTAAINEEIASGEGSEVASAANSESESTYKPKYKSKDGSGSSTPGESTSVSDSTSDVRNTGTIEQEQLLSSPVQVNDNDFGSDESRSAVVGFDLGFEQFTAETQSAEPDIGSSSLPMLMIP
jgi:hypothetical protein